MKSITLGIITILYTLTAFTQNAGKLLSIDEKVDSLLNLMSLEEKIGQMTQAERGALENISDISYYKLGSLLSGGGSSPASNNVTEWGKMYDEYQSHAMQSRLKIPLIYGIDAVHGHNNVFGAVLFPHNIGLGCTWNPDLVKSLNEMCAEEVAATGIDWTFSPCIAVTRDERWGRTYEGFGETPEIQKIMAAVSVDGLQGTDLALPATILACAKHFVGDGGTTNGDDQGNTVISEEALREIHMAGYIDAIEANVGSIMASYSSWNSIKMHGNQYLLTDVLKDELGFEGFIISDWKGVDQVDEDYREAVKRAINAGIDMVMVPDRYIYFISILKDLVENNEVSQSRIDDAVRRILKQKFLLNLFEKPYTDVSLQQGVGSDAHRAIARQAVRESMVVLSAKDDILPLQKNNQKILVAGNMADNLGGQCGGWSISWQGSNGVTTKGTTILQGIKDVAEGSEIIFSASGQTTEAIDVAVVVIGENPYAEGAGDRSSLVLEPEQTQLILDLKKQGIPVITVLISGRPMIIGEALPYTDAFIAAWLPGTEGDGIAEVLFGDYMPKGKLSNSWPRNMAQIPINFGDADYDPLYEYKHGLQNFPFSPESTDIRPLSAILVDQGNKILVSLSQDIVNIAYEANDFILTLDGQDQTALVNEIKTSEFDESILEIYLNSSVESSDVEIEIAYSGTGISGVNNISLENFSNLYAYNAMTSYGNPIEIPGKVEAENYFEMLGIGTEDCSDTGGGLNIGWVEGGDWMKYYVNVTAEGNYKITARISGYSDGSFNLQFADTLNTTLNYNTTNGWQTWQSFSGEVLLPVGIYEMKVTANNNAVNINYFEFSKVTGITDPFESVLTEISLYPNPAQSDINILFHSLKNQNISVNLYDMTGKKIQQLYDGQVISGENNLNFNLREGLHGLYFIELKDSQRRYFKKLIIE